MGTYLCAHVEYKQSTIWFTLCEFDLGKSYEIMTALSDGAATEGWPSDTGLHQDEEASDVYAKQTSTTAQLEGIVVPEAYKWERTFLKAMIECCKALETGGFQVRVLWGRD